MSTRDINRRSNRLTASEYLKATCTLVTILFIGRDIDLNLQPQQACFAVYFVSVINAFNLRVVSRAM